MSDQETTENTDREQERARVEREDRVWWSRQVRERLARIMERPDRREP